jgi:N-formylglutamate deformylase
MSSFPRGEPETYSAERPEHGETHLIVEVPHAGLEVPSDVKHELTVDASQILRDADLYVDELWAGAAKQGASKLVAHVSRYVIDLNRAEDDIDAAIVKGHPAPRPQQSRGIVWRTTTDGVPVLQEPLSYAAFQSRVHHYYRPYHDALKAEVAHKRAKFGKVLVVAAHSMPSIGRPQGPRRADVVPGSQGGTTTSRDVLAMVESHFRQAGLSVAHDEPYKGGFTTQHYGKPSAGTNAVQIELNRAIYVDEKTSKRRVKEMHELAKLLDALVKKLATARL